MSTDIGRESIAKLRDEANKLLVNNYIDADTTSGHAAAEAYKE
jgi:hypothetical protein